MSTNIDNIKTRTIAKLNHPETLEEITGHVANGGSLIDLCQTWDLRYSDVSAWIYKNPERKAAYDAAVQARGEWFIQRVLMELSAIATVDLRQIFTPEGALKNPQDWPRNIAASVAGVDIDELFDGRGADRSQIGWTKRVKMWDKLAALEKIGKHFKMFIEQHEVRGRLTLEDLVAASKKEQTPPAAPETAT